MLLFLYVLCAKCKRAMADMKIHASVDTKWEENNRHTNNFSRKLLWLSVFALVILFTYFAQKSNLEENFLFFQTNSFIIFTGPNPVFITCSGHPASGLAWRLTFVYCSITIQIGVCWYLLHLIYTFSRYI